MYICVFVDVYVYAEVYDQKSSSKNEIIILFVFLDYNSVMSIPKP